MNKGWGQHGIYVLSASGKKIGQWTTIIKQDTHDFQDDIIEKDKE